MNPLFPSPALLGIVIQPWLRPLGVIGLGWLGVVAVLAIVVVLVRLLMPKIAAIAWTTGKEAVLQTPFWVILLGVMALLVLFPFLPYFTFGEDIKVVKENGLTLIMFMSMMLAVWTASTSIADEIEGRTALTVLSKPIGRREFILGKFLGILGPVLILFLVLGVVFLGTVSYKVHYDARESATPDPTWEQCQAEVAQITPGLVLAFLEAAVMTSISVAIATRLPLLPNMMICGTIYVLGHLVPMLAQSALAQKVAIIPFIADLSSTVLPVLDHFNIYGAIATGQHVPLGYLAWSVVYCVLYGAVAMLLALLLFEDRDLA